MLPRWQEAFLWFSSRFFFLVQLIISQPITCTQVRALDLMDKWLKAEGVILSEKLRVKIIKFYSRSHMKLPVPIPKRQSITCLADWKQYDIFKDDQGLGKSFIPSTSGGGGGDFTIPVYKIQGRSTPHEAIFLFKPRDVATQLTVIARSLYINIKPR